MRKLLLSLTLLTLTLQASAQTQVGNSNFEGWEGASSPEIKEPLNWNSFMTASGGLAGAANQQMDRVTYVRPGSTGIYAVRIWCNSIFGVAANGNVTTGQINMGNISPANAANHNKSVTTDVNFSDPMIDSPDSLVVWVKHKPVTTAKLGRVSCVIHNNTNGYKDPNDVAGANTVATAISSISYNGGNWQRLSIPFTYVGTPSNAAFIITTFTTNQTPGGGNGGDTMAIDDMELVYVPRPSFTTSATTVCSGNTITFTNTSTNFPTSYSWTFNGGTPSSSTATSPVVTYSTPGTYTAILTATNQWGSKTTTPVTITVNPLADASLSYAQPTYCPADADPVPTATNAGTFTSTTGLVINSTTGAIDLSASTPGTYTVTNSYNGTCPNTGTTTFTINPPANSTFSYPSNTICVGSSNQTPTIVDAGTFSATPAGLVFVSPTTGVIDVAGSTAGTYIVTYDATGSVACPTSGSSSSLSITITSSPDATFTYAQAAYCADATDPAPVFGGGANGGVFSSTTGLTINSNTGEVDLSASTAGTYTVTNTIAASGACPMVSGTYSITVNPLPTVALGTFPQICVYNPAFALTGGTPAGGSYSGTGVSGGNFNPATAGLGTKTITYSYTDANGCSNTATNTILVDACLGLENNEMTTVSVYPNPTDGKLTLSNVMGNSSFKVISVSGQVVLSGVVSNTANTIDLSSFENGIYVLQLTQEQGLQTVRVVKK